MSNGLTNSLINLSGQAIRTKIPGNAPLVAQLGIRMQEWQTVKNSVTDAMKALKNSIDKSETLLNVDVVA